MCVMSYAKPEKTVAKCSSCGEIHTVEIQNNGTLFLVGFGLRNQCPCGSDELEVLQIEIDSQTSLD